MKLNFSSLWIAAFFSITTVVSVAAFAAPTPPHCKLTVLTTSAYNGGATWNFIHYPNFTLDQCVSVCKDRNVLQTHVEPFSIVMSCKMTHTDVDGKITKAKYRF